MCRCFISSTFQLASWLLLSDKCLGNCGRVFVGGGHKAFFQREKKKFLKKLADILEELHSRKKRIL